MKPKTLPLLILILALLLAGCAPQPAAEPSGPEPTAARPATEAQSPAPSEPVELNVFAAASLTAAFGEIGELFEASHPVVTVAFNFAGSQQLAQQINEGAPADVFASANKTQMDMVIEARGIVTGTQQTFARNRLVAIYPQDNPAGLIELKDLAKPGLKLVFAAQEVPVGQYSLDFLDKATAGAAFGSTFKEDVLKNVVSYEDNVKAVLTKVALGEADAGIVYTSDISGEDADKVGRLDIPDELNVIASYPIAPVLESEHAELAQAFIDLVLSPEGQDILAKYNFIPVNQD
jgi:molybdate transport system substrate-binding protein